MTVYFIFYFTLVILGFFLSLADLYKYDTIKKIYLAIVCVAMTMLAGSRGLTVGYDTWAYNDFFTSSAANRFYGPWEYPGYMEYGFYAVSAMLGKIGFSARFLFYFWSGFIAVSICSFIYKNSKNIPFSTFILLSFPYLYTSLDILRYFVGISIFLLSFDLVKQKRFIAYLVVMLIAAQFHSFCYLYIAFYYMYHTKWSIGKYLLFSTIILLLTFFMRELAIVFSTLFGRYTSYISGDNMWWISGFSGGIKTALMYIVVLILALLAWANTKERNYDFRLMSIILLTVSAIAFTYASICIRFIVVLLPFLAVYLPDMLSDEKCRTPRFQVLYKYIITLICIAYHAYLVLNNWQNVVPYVTFIQ